MDRDLSRFRIVYTSETVLGPLDSETVSESDCQQIHYDSEPICDSCPWGVARSSSPSSFLKAAMVGGKSIAGKRVHTKSGQAQREVNFAI